MNPPEEELFLSGLFIGGGLMLVCWIAYLLIKLII